MEKEKRDGKSDARRHLCKLFFQRLIDKSHDFCIIIGVSKVNSRVNSAERPFMRKVRAAQGRITDNVRRRRL